jgi:hypothetical protein
LNYLFTVFVLDVKVGFAVWHPFDFVVGEGVNAHSSFLQDVGKAYLVLRRVAERL